MRFGQFACKAAKTIIWQRKNVCRHHEENGEITTPMSTKKKKNNYCMSRCEMRKTIVAVLLINNGKKWWKWTKKFRFFRAHFQCSCPKSCAFRTTKSETKTEAEIIMTKCACCSDAVSFFQFFFAFLAFTRHGRFLLCIGWWSLTCFHPLSVASFTFFSIIEAFCVHFKYANQMVITLSMFCHP